MILDLLSVAVGAGGTGVAVLTGLAIRRRPPRPTVLCSCGHNPGSHALPSGQCQAEQKRPSEWDYLGSPVGYEWVRCPCSANDGPEPMSVITDRIHRQLPAGAGQEMSHPS